MGAASADNYTYGETEYANPHAPTAFFDGAGTTTYAYDANGNLLTLTGAATSSFMWDYRNRMISAWVSGATSTYQYDHTIARMAQITPTTTTHYPSKFYSIEYQGVGTTTATSTAYIFHGDTLVAYIEQALADGVATGTPTTYYVHPDHLGSTNVVTDENGDVVEALDYYPYGAERIHSGSADADRTFIGQFGDDPTTLSYLNARYYDPARGQFTSQDPVHLAVGDTGQMRQLVQREQNELLMDPQQLNSYSYARGNPLLLKDPEGKLAFIPVLGYILAGYSAAQIGVDAYDAYNTNVRYGGVFTQAEKNRTNFKLGYDAGTAATGLAASVPRVGMSVFGDMLNLSTASMDILDQHAGEAIYKQYNEERGPFEGAVRGAREIDLSKNNTFTVSTNRPFIGQSNQSNLRTPSASTPSNGSGRYNQLVGSLNKLVSSLSALISSLSSKKK